MMKLNIKQCAVLFSLVLAGLFSFSASAAIYMGSWDVDGTGNLKSVYNETTQIRITDSSGYSIYYPMTLSSWFLLGAEDLDGQPGAELVFSATANNVSSVRVITHKTRTTRDYNVNYASSWDKVAIADLDGKPGKEVLLNVVGPNQLHEYRVLHFPSYFETNYNFSNTSAVIVNGGVVDTDGKPGAEIIVNTGSSLIFIHDATSSSYPYSIGADLWTVFGFSDLDGTAGNELALRHGDYVEVINDSTHVNKKIFVGGNFGFNSFQNADSKGGNEILINKDNTVQTIFYYVPASTGGGGSPTGVEFLLQHAASGMCIHPKGGWASSDGILPIFFPACGNESRIKFKFLENKSLQNVESGRCLHPEGGSENPAVGTRLVFWTGCSVSALQNALGNKKLAFEFTPNGSLRHVNSGLCVHPQGGATFPATDTALVLWNTCDEPKLIFNRL